MSLLLTRDSQISCCLKIFDPLPGNIFMQFKYQILQNIMAVKSKNYGVALIDYALKLFYGFLDLQQNHGI